MAHYFLNLVDPARWESFLRGEDDTWGFSEHRRSQAARLQVGSRLVCLLTGHQAWCGVLKVAGELLPPHDPRVVRDTSLPVRFPVEALAAFPAEQAISAFDPSVWRYLSRTKGVEPRAPHWNTRAGLRGDLADLKADGELLASRLLDRKRGVPLPYEGDTAPTDPDSSAGGLERVTRQILARRGQSAFRNTLLDAYEGRCAVTSCDVVDVLEAAHIVPYSEGGSNHVSNGLLLRADLHVLFDIGLLNVEPEAFTVFLDDCLIASEYCQLHKRPLRLPDAEKDALKSALWQRATWLDRVGKQKTALIAMYAANTTFRPI